MSYPYLQQSGLDFWSPLATTVFNNQLFVFLPIDQVDPREYANPVDHADEASQAAVYTMIARAIGITKNRNHLIGAAIDKYFWDDATQTTTWAGPVTNHASLGSVQHISGASPIGEGNVIGPLRARQLVILRGRYKQDGSKHTHWMLATSFIVNEADLVTHIVANDPWTGRQVLIDPNTKRVVSPDFPLANWRVNGFQVVTLN